MQVPNEHNIDKSQSLVWHFFILQSLFNAKTNIIHPESIYESKYFVSCKKYAKDIIEKRFEYKTEIFDIVY